MELLISVSAVEYDVDHMPGAVHKGKETKYTEYEVWKKHAGDMNSKQHGDNAEIVNDGKTEKYMIGNSFFAIWIKRTKTGYVWSWK